MIFPIEMNTGIVLRKWCWIPNFPLDGIENSFNSGWTRRFPDFPICHVWLPEGSRGFFALDASEWQGPQTSLNGHDAWQIVPHRLNHASCPRLVEGHSILHYRICMYSIYIYIYTYIYYHVLEFFCLVCQSPKLTTLEAVDHFFL